jgi:hypothetical protein
MKVIVSVFVLLAAQVVLAFPKLGDSEEIYSALSQISAEAPLYKTLIVSAGEPYAIRFKSKTVAAPVLPSEKSRDELRAKLAGTRVRDAFTKWNEAVVKASKIERNEAVLEGEAE